MGVRSAALAEGRWRSRPRWGRGLDLRREPSPWKVMVVVAVRKNTHRPGGFSVFLIKWRSLGAIFEMVYRRLYFKTILRSEPPPPSGSQLGVSHPLYESGSSPFGLFAWPGSGTGYHSQLEVQTVPMATMASWTLMPWRLPFTAGSRTMEKLRSLASLAWDRDSLR